jgi:hypothetical protein
VVKEEIQQFKYFYGRHGSQTIPSTTPVEPTQSLVDHSDLEDLTLEF